MAAARTSARPDEPRIACTHCGGLIHPIAGRCKHCRADLTALRGARAPASMGLPALGPAKPAEPPRVIPLPVSAPTAPNTVAKAEPHAVIALPVAAEDSRPVLPPRPTGRMQASGTSARQTRWPYVVIGLALVAIVVAVVLLILPHDGPSRGGARTTPPPAPDRMSTDPKATPGGPSSDPWSAAPDPKGSGPRAQGGNGATPGPKPNPFNPPAAPTPPGRVQPPDIDSVPDPGLGQGLRNPFGGDKQMAMMAAMMKHACDRMTTCSNDPLTAGLCDSVTSQLSTTSTPPTCGAATRCLQQIDTISCDDLDPDATMSPSILTSLVTSVQDCISALTCS